MARVPGIDRVTAPQIAPQVTRLPRLADTSELDAGARAMIQVGQALGAEGEQINLAAAQAQREDEATELQFRERAFKQGLHDLTYGNEKLGVQGYRNTRGRGTLEGAEKYEQDVVDLRKRVTGEIKNQNVTNQFTETSKDIELSARTSHSNYVLGQRKVAEATTDAAGMQLGVNEAVNNVVSLLEDGGEITAVTSVNQDIINDVIQLSIRQAEREGLEAGSKEREDIIKTNLTAMHKTVIERLLSQELSEEASDYLELYSAFGQINESDQGRILAAIRRVENAKIAELSDDVRDVVTVLDFGGNVDPGQLSDLKNKLRSGSGDRAKDLLENVEEAEQTANIVRAFNAQPLPVQQQILERRTTQIRKGTITAAQTREFTKLQRSFANTAKEITAGRGLALAANSGIIRPLVALNTKDASTYRQRRLQAAEASKAYGVPIQPILPSEIKAITAMIKNEDESTPDQVMATIIAMTEGLGRDMAEMVASTAADAEPASATVMAIATDRPLLARDIVAGMRVQEANKDLKPTNAQRQAARDSALGNAFTADTAVALGPLLAAADALYAQRIISTGTTIYDAELHEQAINDIVGGETITSSQREILPPVPGMTESTFNGMLGGMTQPDLIEFGNGVPILDDGSPFTIDMFDRGILDTDAGFLTSGFGRYLVIGPDGGFVSTEDGSAYEIDLRALWESGRVQSGGSPFPRPEPVGGTQ